jgi:hypothetical protein
MILNTWRINPIHRMAVDVLLLADHKELVVQRIHPGTAGFLGPHPWVIFHEANRTITSF